MQQLLYSIHTNFYHERSLSEFYTGKKSNLKYLVECFPKNYSSLDSTSLMMALPAVTSQGLTHEQVLPFLKKMENGQQQEGGYILHTVYLRFSTLATSTVGVKVWALLA